MGMLAVVAFFSGLEHMLYYGRQSTQVCDCHNAACLLEEFHSFLNFFFCLHNFSTKSWNNKQTIIISYPCLQLIANTS